MKKAYNQPTLVVNTFESESFLLSGSPTPDPYTLGPSYAKPGMQF